MTPEFLLTSLVVVLVPGTGVIYTLSTGLTAGGRASIAAALGCTFGIVPHIAASILGVAAILHASAVAFQLLKWAGVAYLLYLAWTMLRDKSAASLGNDRPAGTHARIAVVGTLINILNPKLSLFFLAFMPQFVAADAASPVAEMIRLAAMFMLMTFVVFVGYGIFAAAMRRHVISRPSVMRWMQRIFAGTFVALGLRLALSER